MNLILPFDSLGEENLPLALSDRVADNPEALLQLVVEIAYEQIVHIREVEPVIADVEVLLQLNGVVHRLDGFEGIAFSYGIRLHAIRNRRNAKIAGKSIISSAFLQVSPTAPKPCGYNKR